MSSAVVSTSAALGRPFVFDAKAVSEVSLPSEPAEGRPPQRVRPGLSGATADPRLAHVTPASQLHVLFDTACERANARGMRVTGSELVGLVPLEAMLEAGKYFLRKP